METEGTIEGTERLMGWSGDFYVRINGNNFYKRLHNGNNTELFDMARENIGRKVSLEFEEVSTKPSDWFLDRFLLASFNIPRNYREICRISQDIPLHDARKS